VVPLVLAKGAGAEMRVALGVAVFSGMLGVTIFGIFFTPVFYVVIRWFSGRSAAAPAAAQPSLAAVVTVDGSHTAKDGIMAGGQVQPPAGHA
jgi:multidrug efflux pump